MHRAGTLEIREPSIMKDKLSLVIDKAADDKSLKVAVVMPFDIAGDKGAKVSGSALITPQCSSYNSLEKEIALVKERLDALLNEARPLFEEGSREEQDLDVTEDMSPREIWTVLSGISDSQRLLIKFNSMSHQKRVAVADYVLANCNVFSGPASLFSMRYNAEKGMIE